MVIILSITDWYFLLKTAGRSELCINHNYVQFENKVLVIICINIYFTRFRKKLNLYFMNRFDIYISLSSIYLYHLYVQCTCLFINLFENENLCLFVLNQFIINEKTTFFDLNKFYFTYIYIYPLFKKFEHSLIL